MKFSKYHGTGNDFIIVTEDQVAGRDPNELAAAICRRRYGIGADGLIVVRPGTHYPWRMQIINADGSEAEMCGNGLRCMVRYLYDRGLVTGSSVTIETAAGAKQAFFTAEDDFYVTVNMGQPSFDADSVPVLSSGGQEFVQQELTVGNMTFSATAVSMGNPHCVIFVDNLENLDWQYYGRLVERLPLFPRKTNVEFVEVLERSAAVVRVWERGVGATLACGTGACAVAAAGVKSGIFDEEVNLTLPGGLLQVEWKREGLYLSGVVERVFSGYYY